MTHWAGAGAKLRANKKDVSILNAHPFQEKRHSLRNTHKQCGVLWRMLGTISFMYKDRGVLLEEKGWGKTGRVAKPSVHLLVLFTKQKLCLETHLDVKNDQHAGFHVGGKGSGCHRSRVRTLASDSSKKASLFSRRSPSRARAWASYCL